ncbi:MAG: hypothetical protein HQL51_11650 [Magnetococcales bacterium]|nr:hypothetical protein [Magnetococcales bacterium]
MNLRSLLPWLFCGALLAPLLAPEPASAHGPGRPVRAEIGLTGGDDTEFPRVRESAPRPVGEEQPLTLKLRNLENYPVTTRLRFVPGGTDANGVDYCLIPAGESPPGLHGYFPAPQQQSCREVHFTLPPGGSTEQQARVVRAADPAGRQIRCVIATFTPIPPPGLDLHKEGFHLKGARQQVMLRLPPPPPGAVVQAWKEPLSAASTLCDTVPKDSIAHVSAHDHSAHAAAGAAPAPGGTPAPGSPATAPAPGGAAPMDHSAHMAPGAAPAGGMDHSAHAGHNMGGAGGAAGAGGDDHVMMHPGVPAAWLSSAATAFLLFIAWGILTPAPERSNPSGIPSTQLPLVGGFFRWLTKTPWPLILIKWLSMAIFLLVIYAGFAGTQKASDSFATTFVWNIWWPLVIVSVLILGTGWCSFCPWDTLATFLVRFRVWSRKEPHPGLNLKVPKALRNVFPALALFLGLTWLELGLSATTRPDMTAVMGLVMVFLSVSTLLIYERKAFCRYFCPVGRTLGFYARLAPVAVRPMDQATCDGCKTMECYRGSETIPPCPTHLTVGRFGQNTFCLSCGACFFSCPYKNVSWQFRPMGSEARLLSRPAWDGAWFMLTLLGTTLFHGFSMTPAWEAMLTWIALRLGETGELPISFGLGMLFSVALPIVGYTAAAWLTGRLLGGPNAFREAFGRLTFAILPLAFTYHLAHNLSHLFMESTDWGHIFRHPLGDVPPPPMDMAAFHAKMGPDSLAQMGIFSLQMGLMALGVYLFVQIVRYRGLELRQESGTPPSGWRMAPIYLYGLIMACGGLWLMSLDMVMRF